jgi:hypothetical protein
MLPLDASESDRRHPEHIRTKYSDITNKLDTFEILFFDKQTY